MPETVTQHDPSRAGQRRRANRPPSLCYTAFALFDHSLDAERSLVALQRDDLPAESVSIIIRDRASSGDRSAMPTGDVARALVASAMGALGQWLVGLASLIVEDRGTYLVAGPIGAILASVGSEGMPEFPHEPNRSAVVRDDEIDLIDPTPHDDSDSIYQTMMLYGTSEDDANYLENRLVAGTALVAVTTTDRRAAARSRNEFDAQGAVFLKVVVTSKDTVNLAREKLEQLAAARSTGEIVVTDAVAPLRRLCQARRAEERSPGCGATVQDEEGKALGTIEDILADPIQVKPDGDAVVRYVVVAVGGIWKIGRQYVAVPVDLVRFESPNVATLLVGLDVFREAPRYDRGGAFSRREELAVLAYFGVRPYWLAPGEEATLPAAPDDEMP